MPLRWPRGADAGGPAVFARAFTPSRRANPEARMPLIEHIRELRARLIKALLGVGAGMVVGWIFFNPVWDFLARPYCRTPIHGRSGCGAGGHPLVVTGVFDAFFVHLKIALVVGLIIASPVWLYQVWAFIAPGLYARERRWTYLFVGTAVPLFLAGGVFAYLAMSRGLRFILGGMLPNGVQPFITLDTYLGYAMAMLLIFGLAFELPLSLVILNLAGVLTHDRFKKWRRVMIFGVFVFAAVATPSPDPFTMLMLALPCAALVELAELTIWANDRRRARRPSPYAGLSPDEASPLDLDDLGSEHADADLR